MGARSSRKSCLDESGTPELETEGNTDIQDLILTQAHEVRAKTKSVPSKHYQSKGNTDIQDQILPQAHDVRAKTKSVPSKHYQSKASHTPYFNGIVVIEDKLLVIDDDACNLQFYNCHDGTLISISDKLDLRPYGVCLISKTEICVCLSDCTIIILPLKSINDKKLVKTLKVTTGFRRCYSVAKLTSDKLAVSGWKCDGMFCWGVVSITDECLDSTCDICKGDIGRTHLAINKNTIYISCLTSDSITTGVYAYDIHNPYIQKFLYQHQELEEPGSIIAVRDYVYVCDFDRIHQLTDSGQLVTIYTVSSSVNGIFYDDQHRVLYTTSYKSNVITVYKMEYLYQPDNDVEDVIKQSSNDAESVSSIAVVGQDSFKWLKSEFTLFRNSSEHTENLPKLYNANLSIKPTSTDVERIVSKKKPHKPKHRHNHNNQESSDSETDSCSASTYDESPSADDSNDSPAVETTNRSKTKKKSRSTIINAPGGIIDFGKNNKNKIVHISYVRQTQTKNKDKDRSSTSHRKGNVRKICDETDTISNIMEMIEEVSKSVGIIRSPLVQGTGFRVGESYIMTALHVVEGIINPVLQPLNHREGETNLKLLGDRKVHIDFASQQGQVVQENTLRFNFEPQIFYQNKALDTVVLKLKHSSSNFPCQLTQFCDSVKNLPMYFIGHSNNQVKTFDKTNPRYLTESKIKQYQIWSQQHQIGCRENYRGYYGAADPKKILFDYSASFNKGASGSPGFIISSHDKMPYVASMLLHGYPDWYDDEEVKEKSCIPSQYTIEQGVRIIEVYKDMKANDPSLWSEIFGTYS